MEPNMKQLSIRVEKEIWAFLKMQSVKQERPINSIVTECIQKIMWRKKTEKKIDKENKGDIMKA